MAACSLLNSMNRGEILIYQTETDAENVEVTFHNGDVWLSQAQMALLFDRNRTVIGRHLKNVFETGELDENAVGAFFAHTAPNGKTYQTRYFNLDAILSVAYRVNSKQGTQFRKWASRILISYLLNGYVLNSTHLSARPDKLNQLNEAIKWITEAYNGNRIEKDIAPGLVELIEHYAHNLNLLNQFDEGSLTEPAKPRDPDFVIGYADCLPVIAELKQKFMANGTAGKLFGNEKDDSFEGIIGAVNQTVFGMDAYPSVQEKAAHLLYFIIKNHPFSDGNKRIGAFLFVWYLERNHFNQSEHSTRKISPNALTALSLLVAQSNPSDKEMIIKLIENLIG